MKQLAHFKRGQTRSGLIEFRFVQLIHPLSPLRVFLRSSTSDVYTWKEFHVFAAYYTETIFHGCRFNRYAKVKEDITPLSAPSKESSETKGELLRFEEIVEDNSRGSFTRRNPAPSSVLSLTGRRGSNFNLSFRRRANCTAERRCG